MNRNPKGGAPAFTDIQRLKEHLIALTAFHNSNAMVMTQLVACEQIDPEQVKSMLLQQETLVIRMRGIVRRNYGLFGEALTPQQKRFVLDAAEEEDGVQPSETESDVAFLSAEEAAAKAVLLALANDDDPSHATTTEANEQPTIGVKRKRRGEGVQTHCKYENCGFVASSRRKAECLRRHYRQHEDKSLHQCPVKDCNRFYSSRAILLSHSRVAHPDEHELCLRDSRLEALEAMAVEQRLPVRPRTLEGIEDGVFECAVPGCGANFDKQASLKEHYKRHITPRRYMCTVDDCGVSCTTQHGMWCHFRREHKELFRLVPTDKHPVA